MDAEVSRFLLGLLFLVIGIALFAGAIVVKLRMEKEVIGDKRVLRNSHFPVWHSDEFSDRGNKLRKIYNVIYFALIVYGIALIVFMKVID